MARILDPSLHRALTLIVAPAGSGKTATLAAWSAARNDQRGVWNSPADRRSVRWLRGSSRVSRLASAVLAAAGVLVPPPSDKTLSTNSLDVVDGCLRNLDLATGNPDVIVVDDAHQLSPACLGLLRRILRYRPDMVHLILATRHDLPLPVVELELAEQAATIRGDQFVFTDDEADRLITVHGVVEQDDRAAIISSSRGWAAALVLGARAIAGAVDRGAARTALLGSHQPILDYLLGEVFTTLPARTRHVLLCTGAREEVSASEAVVLSAETDAPMLLAELAQAGLLVSASECDGQLRWTYHPLLRELLRRHVGPGCDDHPLFAAAQVRAAQHCLAHGDVSEAIELAIRAADAPRLIRILTEHGPTIVSAGQHALMGQALEALPFALRQASPGLNALAALERCSVGDFDTAMTLAPDVLNAADGLLSDQAPAEPTESETADAERGALVVDAAILGCWLARIGLYDLAGAANRARLVLGCPPARSDGVHGHAESGFRPARRWPPSMARKAWLMIELAASELGDGNIDDAAVHLAEASTAARAMGNANLLVRALADQAILAVMNGTSLTAAELGREAVQVAAANSLADSPVLARAYLAVSWAHYFALDLGNAVTLLEQAERHAVRSNDPMLHPLLLVLRAHLSAALGNLDSSRRLLADPQLEAFTREPYVGWMVAFSRGVLALQAGDLPEARRHAATMRTRDWLGGGSFFDGWLESDGGNEDRALAIFEHLRSVEASASPVHAGAAAVHTTAILLERHDKAGAEKTLREALNWITPQHHWHLLLAGMKAGSPFFELLRSVAFESESQSSVRQAYEVVAAFLRRSVKMPAAAETGRQLVSPPARTFAVSAESVRSSALGLVAGNVSLTPREADVLSELALGDSYVDIGRTLYVTENTVKTHVAAIYRKLGSTRRADALRQARALGLL